MKKLKLYRWLLKKFSKFYRDEYLNINKSDYKCSNCHQWYSISIIKPNYEQKVENTNFGWCIRCQNCGANNYWNCDIAMLPIACNERGGPLK